MIDFDIDSGLRLGAFDIAAAYEFDKYVAAEVRFIDEGQQPFGIKNVNRVLNTDAIFSYPIDDLSLCLKAGLTSSFFSYNGSGNSYKNNTGLTGFNYGGCVDYKIVSNWYVQGQMYNLVYQQSDKPGREAFQYGSIGVKYKFGGFEND